MPAFLSILAALLLTAAAPPDGEQPTLRAVRVAAAAPPTLDGRLDEAAWAGAEAASGFTQLRPDAGEPASQRTEVLVLYDDDALWVGFRCHDTEPEAIIARLVRRDEWTESDKVLVALDSYGDGRTAFSFGVNAAGVKYDLLTYNDTDEDFSWDAVWDAAVARTADGWSAEFRLPLSQLPSRSCVPPAPTPSPSTAETEGASNWGTSKR